MAALFPIHVNDSTFLDIHAAPGAGRVVDQRVFSWWVLFSVLFPATFFHPRRLLGTLYPFISSVFSPTFSTSSNLNLSSPHCRLSCHLSLLDASFNIHVHCVDILIHTGYVSFPLFLTSGALLLSVQRRSWSTVR